MNEFELDFEWSKILFSFQYDLTSRDIDSETERDIKKKKGSWCCRWKKGLEHLLRSKMVQSTSYKQDPHLITDFDRLVEQVKVLRPKAKVKTLYILLLELVLFEPYYPLGVEEDKEYKDLKTTEQFNKNCDQILSLYAHILGLDSSYMSRFQSSYKKFVEQLQDPPNFMGFIFGGLVGAVAIAVAAAFALPLVVAALAPLLAPGLYGAAAVSAVLAALGGGAIAAGGFGMAGGVVVIIGGGAILGGGIGTGIGALFTQSPESVIPQAAKLLVVFQDIILAQKNVSKQKIADEARAIIQKLRESISSYEDEVCRLNLEPEVDQEKIKNLEKVIRYLRRAWDICQRLLKQFIDGNGLK